MKILVVEDDENKRSQLMLFVNQNYPNVALTESRSLQSGVRHIRNETFDLILLDMTLPNYDAGPEEPGGGLVHSFGGREFLKQMERFEIMTPVIVVTQFETFGKAPQTTNLVELDASLKDEFGETYCGAVYYHAAIQSWHDQLINMIAKTLSKDMGNNLHD